MHNATKAAESMNGKSTYTYNFYLFIFYNVCFRFNSSEVNVTSVCFHLNVRFFTRMLICIRILQMTYFSSCIINLFYLLLDNAL